MTRKNHKTNEFGSIHIGNLIEEELRRQERTVAWLSRKIHCDRRNVYDIFSRTSIDTDLLYKISIALQKDFFIYFSAKIQQSNSQILSPQPTTARPTLSNLSYLPLNTGQTNNRPDPAANDVGMLIDPLQSNR